MKISKTKFDIALARACMSARDLRQKGLSPTTISNVIRGNDLTPKMVGKIARALGVDVTDLLDTNSSSPRTPSRDIAGYSGTGPNTGIFVAADDALDFAMERCGVRMVDRRAPEYEEFLEMFEEWFFSSWVKEVAADDQRTA